MKEFVTELQEFMTDLQDLRTALQRRPWKYSPAFNIWFKQPSPSPHNGFGSTPILRCSYKQARHTHKSPFAGNREPPDRANRRGHRSPARGCLRKCARTRRCCASAEGLFWPDSLPPQQQVYYCNAFLNSSNEPIIILTSIPCVLFIARMVCKVPLRDFASSLCRTTPFINGLPYEKLLQKPQNLD